LDAAAAPGFSQPLPEAIRAGRVAALYRQAVPGLIVGLGVAATCAAVLWHAVDRVGPVRWFLAVLIATGLRLWLVRAYRARPRAVEEAPAWENRFAAGAAVTGVVWGLLALLAGDASYALQVFVAFAFGGMTIGAMGAYSSSRRTFLALVAPMLAALALRYFYLGGELYSAMGLLVLLFFAFAFRIFHSLQRTVTQNIERGIANERLLAERRGLFDAATVGLAFIRDRALVDCNPEFERILGWPRAALVPARGDSPALSDARWRAAVEEAYERAALGEAYRGELALTRGDGKLIWCDLSGRAVIPGQPDLGLLLSCADITERKGAEAALRGSEERLELVVRASQGGHWDWNIGADQGYFSPRFKEILGEPPDALIGGFAALQDRVHPEDSDRALAAWQKALTAPPGPFDCEYRMRRADGSYVWVHARGMVLCDARQRPLRSVGSLIDISDRKAIEEQLRESEQHFRYLVEAANDLVWAVDRDGRWTYLSPRATRQIFGCDPEDMLQQRFVDSQPESEHARTFAMLRRVLADGTASHFETRHINRKGDEIVLSFNATPLRAAGGAIAGVTGTATDTTEVKAKQAELAAALAEQELIFDSVSEGIVFLKQRTVHKCNRKFAEMLGYAPQELVGQPSLVWYAEPTEWEHIGRQARATMTRAGNYQTELLVRRKDGSAFWCDIRGRAVDPERIEEGTIFIFIDISARKEREQRIQHLADHDALTGLLNRRLLEDRLQQAINLARRNGTMLALMLIDLDGFKAVNDQYGHLMGDYVLRTVAKRLAGCVRESDTVARLGGDEFVILLTGQRSPEDSSVVAEKILGAFAEPVAAGGRRFMIGASIGISVFPRDGAAPEALLKHADAAMYRVKEAGKNRFEFYSS